MEKTLPLKLTLLISLVIITFKNYSQEWTWMKGTNLANQFGIYGTQGTGAAGNTPGSRVASVTWQDNSGNFWMFGGGGWGSSASSAVGLSDLWKYNVSSNQWTWMAGPTSPDLQGIYGTLGVAAAANFPGGRQASMSWIDNSGNLWLFGGYGADISSGGILSDLWKFDITLNQWMWVNGPNTAAQNVVYGTQGVSAPANTPGSRSSALTWKDTNGDFWLFGGVRGLSTFSDLWKYTLTTNQWTWVNGSNLPNQNGVYGTQGVAAPTNLPGARVSSSTWVDNSGNFWLYGGNGNASSSAGFLNDLWKYNISSNQWTWMQGSNTISTPANYGTLGIPAAANTPGARWNSANWKDNQGNFYLFAGEGFNSTAAGRFSDVWKYTLSTNQWTWVKGPNTLNQLAIYGTIGTQAITNNPGSRWGPLSWSDNSGNFWMFGGYGNHSTSVGYLNDLWKFVACTILPPNPLNTTSLVNQNICIGNTTTLSATSSTLSVNWFATLTSTSVLATGNNFTTTALPVGTYTYYAEGNGCQPSTNRTAVTFTVNALPTITVNSGAICLGKIFTLVPSGALTYTFSGGSNTVSPSNTSTYSVVGKNSMGCLSSNTAIATVTVYALPLITANSGSICPGKTFTIIPGGAITYTYSGGFATVSPTVSTNYSVTGTDANNCVSGSAAIASVVVNPQPTLSASSSSTLICEGESALLMVIGADTYSWSSGQSGNSISVNPTITTTYTITGTNTSGCYSTINIVQQVNKCTGINTLAGENGKFNLYPNPNNGEFEMEVSAITKMEIYSISGQLICTKDLIPGKNKVNLSEQDNGIYFAKLIFDNETKVLRIIKNN